LAPIVNGTSTSTATRPSLVTTADAPLSAGLSGE